jgi:DNA repair protein RadA/Sms
MAAVVDRAMGFRLTRSELYGAAAGGLRVDDPGADLAVAAALASAATGVAPPPGSAFAGEVGLTGSLRPAPSPAPRLAAAVAARVKTVFLAGAADPPPGVRIVRVRRVEEALRWATPRSGARRIAAGGGSGSGGREDPLREGGDVARGTAALTK